MVSHPEQFDQRLAQFRPLLEGARPSRGWIRAIRDTLGMTTKQLALRVGVSQPRIVKLEQAEVDRSITLNSLERAAEALDCRVVYALIPNKPLAQMLQERAGKVAERQLAAVDQTMRLEAQGVTNTKARDDLRKRLVQDALRRPARLWDEL